MPRTTQFEELLQESAWLRTLAHSLVQDGATHDDVVQESWLAALRSPPPEGRPARPWLTRVALNAVRMGHRTNSRRRDREHLAATHQIEQVSPEDLLQRLEVQKTLAEVVSDLDEPFRTTILLRYYEGMSAVEIASREEIPASTVRWRTKRALEQLRDNLDRRGGHVRGSWSLALAPLIDIPTTGLAMGNAAFPTVKGLIAMKIVKAGVVAALIAGSIGVVASVSSGDATSNSEPAEAIPDKAVAQPGPSTAVDDKQPTRKQHARRFQNQAERQALVRAIAKAREKRQAAGPEVEEVYEEVERVVSREPTPEEAEALGEYIEDGVADIKELVGECYDLSHAQDSNMDLSALDVDVTLTGEPEIGAVVEDAEMRSETGLEAHPILADCIRETIFSLQFPPPPIEDAKIKFTYRIEQEQEPEAEEGE